MARYQFVDIAGNGYDDDDEEDDGFCVGNNIVIHPLQKQIRRCPSSAKFIIFLPRVSKKKKKKIVLAQLQARKRSPSSIFMHGYSYWSLAARALPIKTWLKGGTKNKLINWSPWCWFAGTLLSLAYWDFLLRASLTGEHGRKEWHSSLPSGEVIRDEFEPVGKRQYLGP